ncbi:uncharacterized protein LOC142345675 [Convolutriloba macropyga]|uniref:uncharacterized protein LOC142345675 n=1 Tax=Convolutriloba macropyga TaxID=536237 RepID=UPI003F525A5B
MQKSERESAFDLLKTTVTECIKADSAAQIPQDLWNSVSADKLTGNTKNAGYAIRSFDFELNGEFFASANVLNVNSLFFEYVFNGTMTFNSTRSVRTNMADRRVRKIVGNDRKLDTNQFFAINFVSSAEFNTKSAMLEEDIIEKVLRGGVKADGNVFNLLGCSNSGVQSRSFYFMRGPLDQCEEVMSQLINLTKLGKSKGVAKRTKYVGLLFTGCQHIVNLPPDLLIESAEDIERDNFNFTDGCGFISYALAEWVWRNNPSVSKKWTFVPSVWQIRYYGNGKLCKGVLVVDNRDKTKHSISFRPSMVKVKVDDVGTNKAKEHLWLKLGIVSTNHIAKIGKLNKQVIALLSANIPLQKLQSIQDCYLQQTENARRDSVAALHCYSLKLKLPMFAKLLRQHKASIVPGPFVNLPLQVENLDSEKLKIPVACSRLLIGASFPELLRKTPLRDGECIVLSELGPVLGDVVVCRSPSYSPGDIRVLTAVPPAPSSHVSDLKNVILFSTEGSRPDPDKMSGGDLDGDLYLVIWDQRILEYSETLRKVPAESYEVPKPDKNHRMIEDKSDWIRYVAQWENSLLAQIDWTFFKLASQKGISSRDCQELSALFSRAVDQIPSDLDQLKQKMAQTSGNIYHGPFVQDFEKIPIWEKMWQKQQQLLEKLGKTRNATVEIFEYQTFFNTLVNKSETEIVEILTDKNIAHTATTKQVEQIKKYWIILSSKHFVQVLPSKKIKSEPDNLLPLCIYDCIEKECRKRHPKTLEWYNSWADKMKLELNFFIRPILDKIDGLNETLTEQEKRLKFALSLYEEKFSEIKRLKTVLMGNLQVVHKHRSKVSITFNKAIELRHLYSELEKITNQREPGFFTNLLRGIQNKLAKVFLKRDRKLTAEERELLERYKKVHSDIDNKSKDLECALISEETSYLDLQQKLRPLISPRNLRFKDTENADIGEIRKRGEFCNKLKQTIIDLHNSYQDPIMSEEVHKLEQTLMSKIRIITNREKKLSTEKERINSMIDQVKVSNPGKHKVITPEITQTVPSLWSLSQKVVFGCLKGKLFHIEREQAILDKRKKYLQERLEQAYSPEIHQNTLTEIEKETEKSNPFNLAVCAALNEVNSRFHLYSAEDPDRRVGVNKELKMCLLREKNRCKQECSGKQLPIFSKRFEIMSALRDHNAMIVVAQTGSGKSTQVPQYLADDLHHVLKHLEVKNFPKVVCTQPRRVAATKIAQRVSLEYSGSIDSTKKTEDKSKPAVLNSNKAEVVAYPLYASSGSETRALDENDRLGWYKQLPSHLSKHKTHSPKNPDENSMAQLEGTLGEVGGWVGFQIGSRGQTLEQRKDSKKISSGTRIEFVTEGLLLQKLKNQQESTSYDCVIVDEAHERGKDTDFLMALLKKMLQNENCKLKVVVMSASINQQQFSDYFGKCPIIECEGKMFDVEEFYKPVSVKSPVTKIAPSSKTSLKTSLSTTPGNSREYNDAENEELDVISNYSSLLTLNDDIDSQNELFGGKNKLVVHAVDILFREVHPKERGDVLIFLPGKKEIHNTVELIRERAEREFAENASRTHPGYVRKIVCCTNIAETSLTIPGVKFVIDVGQAKKITYDHELRISALVLNNNSQASAKQRKGRAGRIETGYCYRLCSKEEFDKLEEFDAPELKQCPIDELYLYAVSTFGSMEQLELMPDAKPCEKSVQFAKQRLVNLEFIQVTKQMFGHDKVELTSDGKLAVSLLGELSIEAIRMILATKKVGMIKHALQLAVLMKNSNDLQVKEPTDTMTEKFNVYLDELGDAFTWFKIYTTYLEIKGMKKHSQMITKSGEWRDLKMKGVKQWCQDLGVSLTTLQLVDKSVDSVYQTLKRLKVLGDGPTGCGFRDLDIPLSELREHLCKALISGYFHNTAELHDINFLKAGYSMLTSGNIKRPSCREDESDNVFSIVSTKKHHHHLLKLELSNRSSLTKRGDVVQNTYLVFTNLFKAVSTGRIFMEQACRVTPQMIIENSNENWRKQCQIRPAGNRKLQSVVTRDSKEFVGPKVLGKILKTSDEKKYLKELEEQSGAKVNFMFDHGQIRVYGSQCEVANVLEHSSLQSDVVEQQKQCLQGDFRVSYPLGNGKKLGCFDPGLRLDFNKAIFDEGKTIEDWKSVKKSSVIFRKIDHNKIKILERNIRSMKLQCPDQEIKDQWGNARVLDDDRWTKSSISYCKITFRSANVANYVCNNFSSYKMELSDETHCFLDNNEEIPVIDTRIYPSVLKLSKIYPGIDVKTRGGHNPCFLVRPKEKNDEKHQVNEFKQALADSHTFSSKTVENISFGFATCFKQEILECLNLVKESTENKMKRRNYKLVDHFTTKTNPSIEIFGDDKNEVAKTIEQIITQIKHDIREEILPLFYFTEIELQRHQFATILRHLELLRANYPRVEFNVKSGSNFSRNDLVKPSIQIMTREKDQGIKCAKEIRKVLENSGSLSETISRTDTTLPDIRCCMCSQEVILKKFVNKKAEQEQKGSIHININKTTAVKSLTLCGCIYCPSCLFITVSEQIQSEHFAKKGLKCANVSEISRKDCNQTIMNQDLKDNLTSKRWKQTLDAAWSAYVNFWESNPSLTEECKLEICPSCEKGHKFSKNSRGVFSCSQFNISYYYCVKCKGRVTNEIDFEDHQKRCMLTPRRSRPVANNSFQTITRGLQTTSHLSKLSAEYHATEKSMLETCPNCESYRKFSKDSRGVFRCSQCNIPSYYCVKCKSRVTNELELEDHQKRCMLKPNRLRPVANNDANVDVFRGLSTEYRAIEKSMHETLLNCERGHEFSKYSRGIFSCSRCNISFCLKCKREITNEIEFEDHQKRCMLTPRSSRPVAIKYANTDVFSELSTGYREKLLRRWTSSMADPSGLTTR